MNKPTYEELEIKIQELEKEKELLLNSIRVHENQLSKVIHEVGIGIAIIDKMGRFIEVNQNVCDALGYSAEDFLNLDYLDITYPDEVEKSKQRFMKCLKNHKCYHVIKTYKTAMGEPIKGMTTISPLINTDGVFDHAIVHVQMTEK